MKIFILTIIVFFSNLNCLEAQESENRSHTLIAGGTFSVDVRKNSENPFILSSFINGVTIRQPLESNSGSFSINPYLGSQISENLIIGGRGLFSISNSTANNINFFDPLTGSIITGKRKENGSSVGIGLFTRYTFNPSKVLNIFIQNAADYVHQTSSTTIEGTEIGKEKTDYFQLSASPGISWKLSDKFSLLANMGTIRFLSGKWEEQMIQESQNFSTFEANFNLSSFRFGIEFNF